MKGKILSLPSHNEGGSVPVTEAAKRLGVCRRTVYNYIYGGFLKTTPNGRVTVRSINKFLREEMV